MNIIAPESFSTGTTSLIQDDKKSNAPLKRDFNYKTYAGYGKKVPVYLPAASDESGNINENVRLQQTRSQESTSSKGKASRTSAKYPPTRNMDSQVKTPLPINDIRNSDKFPEQTNFVQTEKRVQQQNKQPLTPKPSRPTVSFAIPPPPPKEAFRPPTPVPFMHRVNSLPYVAVPEDDSTFFSEPHTIEGFEIQEPNFEDSTYFTTRADPRPNTPVVRNTPNPLFLPTLDLPDLSSVDFYSSGSSRQLSPSLRDRSPSLPIFIPVVPFYRKRKYQVLFIVILLVLFVLFMYR